MTILWISNIDFPEVLSLLNNGKEHKDSGGWLFGAADAISMSSDVTLVVASVSKQVKELTYLRGKRINYYLVPYGKGNTTYNSAYEEFWRVIQKQLSPDIIHIHGTEYTHGLAYVNTCGAKNVVVSVQGLVSVISRYYYAGISLTDILRTITVRDLFRSTLIQDKHSFEHRGKYEQTLIQKVSHVIGRTRWDKSHIWSINPKVKYYHCDEILRPEFYDGSLWRYDKCKIHTIFLSQGTYPIKGLHIILKAMPYILSRYPNASIRIAGADITRSKEGFMGKMRLSGYGNYIRTLIRKYQLADKICFLGNLTAKQMKQEYLTCNVFVLPSAIENSPNSLAEAQILGTPSVASYVGGVPDFMRGVEPYIYRYDDEQMLADTICNVFENTNIKMTNVSAVRERHSSADIVRKLLDIYADIYHS